MENNVTERKRTSGWSNENETEIENMFHIVFYTRHSRAVIVFPRV